MRGPDIENLSGSQNAQANSTTSTTTTAYVELSYHFHPSRIVCIPATFILLLTTALTYIYALPRPLEEKNFAGGLLEANPSC